MTKDHKVLFKGRMIKAIDFVSKVPHVTTIPYNRELLYNILMETYSIVNVNNMPCETLHPQNAISIAYKEKYKLSNNKKKLTMKWA